MSQDNQAEFINTHYEQLQPKVGPNIPSIDEAEYVFVIKNNKDVVSVIHEIIQIANCLR